MMQRIRGSKVLELPLIIEECGFDELGSVFMGICSDGHPYKISGCAKSIDYEARMLARGYQPRKMMQGVILRLTFFHFSF